MSRFARLVCLNGPAAGHEYQLTDDITVIGRSAECAIRIEDQYASRHHAEIRRLDDAYQVHDLQSKNGVVVEGERLRTGGTAWLQDGMQVQFAATLFRFLDPSATVTAPSLMAVRESGLRIDEAGRQVFVDGVLLTPPLSAKQFDLLWYLFQNRGRAISKDEIAQAVWTEEQGDTFDANIDRMVSRVRSRIEPNLDGEPRFIATVRGFGYQFNQS